MRNKLHDVFWLPATVLFLLGVCDIARGVMHTFGLRYAAEHVAGFDPLAAPTDQYFLLGVFGITNFLTGLVFILISRRARELSPYVLILIPSTYLLGAIGIRASQVYPEAAFNGKYFMAVYFTICVTTFAVFLVHKRISRAAAPHGQDGRPAVSPPSND